MKQYKFKDLGQGLVRIIRFYYRNTSKHFIGPWVTVPVVLQWYNLELFYNLSALYKDSNNISVKNGNFKYLHWWLSDERYCLNRYKLILKDYIRWELSAKVSFVYLKRMIISLRGQFWYIFSWHIHMNSCIAVSSYLCLNSVLNISWKML